MELAVNISPEWEDAVNGVMHQGRRFAMQGTPVEYVLAHLRATESERDKLKAEIESLKARHDEIFASLLA